MNKLYGILVSLLDTISSEDYYKKLHTPVQLSERGLKLLHAFLDSVPETKTTLFACFLCSYVRYSSLWVDIKKHDPENTYTDFIRDPDASKEDPEAAVTSLLLPAPQMNRLLVFLDSDIKDRLQCASWLDAASAVCLQLLRELVVI